MDSWPFFKSLCLFSFYGQAVAQHSQPQKFIYNSSILQAPYTSLNYISFTNSEFNGLKLIARNQPWQKCLQQGNQKMHYPPSPAPPWWSSGLLSQHCLQYTTIMFQHEHIPKHSSFHTCLLHAPLWHQEVSIHETELILGPTEELKIDKSQR